MRTVADFSVRFVPPLFVVLALSCAATMLSACNTTAGIGQDVSATGHAVTNTADKVKQGL